MRAIAERRGYATKWVTVADVTTETDEEVIDFAIASARETRSSLFGWGLSRADDGLVTVALHID